jgi:hypothetical protein
MQALSFAVHIPLACFGIAVAHLTDAPSAVVRGDILVPNADQTWLPVPAGVGPCHLAGPRHLQLTGTHRVQLTGSADGR